MGGIRRIGVGLLVLVGLGACSGTEISEIFAPDPRLQEEEERQQQPEGQPEGRVDGQATAEPTEAEPTTQGEDSPPAAESAVESSAGLSEASLTETFPAAIPLYPQRGELLAREIDPEAGRGEVSWELPADPAAVLEFYTTELPPAGWELEDATSPETLVARQGNLQLDVTAREERLTLRYESSGEPATEPADVPTPAEDDTPAAPIATTPLAGFTDLDTAPAPLQSHLQDVAALEILTPLAPGTRSFGPERPVRRRTFARWLAAAHGTIWRDRPEWQIRPAPTAEPLFDDVPATDPDFETIQSLAVAGIIPSTLGGEDGPTTFAPNDPLTRETLLTWKVPLDWHRGLPEATVEDVRAAWGFQDADRISPASLAAVTADATGGDRANLRRVFGYTQLLQPQQPVTRAEAAAALWFFGIDADTGRSAAQVLSSEAPPPAQPAGADDANPALNEP